MDITVFDITTIASCSTMNADAQYNKPESVVLSMFKSINYILQFNIVTLRDFRHIEKNIEFLV